MILHVIIHFFEPVECVTPSECHSVMSDSLRPHGLYSPWNSPGQNTGVGSLSLLQGIFPTQGWTQVLCIVGAFFTSWAMRSLAEWLLSGPRFPLCKMRGWARRFWWWGGQFFLCSSPGTIFSHSSASMSPGRTVDAGHVVYGRGPQPFSGIRDRFRGRQSFHGLGLGGGMVSGWFEHTVFIVYFISTVTTSAPPQIFRH